MATAVPIDDGVNGWDQYLEVTETGFVGHKHYKADSRILSEALTAGGMPRRGDPWDATLGQLEVTGIAPVYRGGVVAELERGTSVWKVSYKTPEAQILDPTGGAWTELDSSDVQVTVYQGVDEAGEPSGEVIRNGAPRDTGQVACTVYTYVPRSTGPQLRLWVPFVGFVNSVETVLPRMQKSPLDQTFDPGELLYLGPRSFRDVGASIEVGHYVKIAPDWLHRESRARDNGEVVGVREVRIHGQRDFRSILT